MDINLFKSKLLDILMKLCSCKWNQVILITYVSSKFKTNWCYARNPYYNATNGILINRTPHPTFLSFKCPFKMATLFLATDFQAGNNREEKHKIVFTFCSQKRKKLLALLVAFSIYCNNILRHQKTDTHTYLNTNVPTYIQRLECRCQYCPAFTNIIATVISSSMAFKLVTL